MLEAAQLKPGETLYDLGSGDGRIVITAAQMFKANAVGVEISDVGRSGAQEWSVAGEPRTKAGC